MAGTEASTTPGLRDYEAGFLRLVDKLTSGCQVEINETGTRLRYRPGMISGGTVEHECGGERAIGRGIFHLPDQVRHHRSNRSSRCAC